MTTYSAWATMRLSQSKALIRLLSSLAVLLLISAAAFAQPPTGTVKKFTIKSTVLGEDRIILVRTPAGYETNKLSYPVLYMTDGDGHMGHTASTIEFLTQNGRISDLIVVGVTNTDRTRDLTPAKSRDKDAAGNLRANRRLALRPSAGHHPGAALGFLARGKLLLFLVPLAFAVAGGLLWAMVAVVVAGNLIWFYPLTKMLLWPGTVLTIMALRQGNKPLARRSGIIGGMMIAGWFAGSLVTADWYEPLIMGCGGIALTAMGVVERQRERTIRG